MAGTALRSTLGRVLWWLLVLPGLVWVVIRLIGLERGPLVQLLAFTPYVALWSVVPLVVSLSLRQWWVAGVAAVVVLAFAWVVVPRWVGAGTPVSAGGGTTIRVLTANMLYGGADPATLIDLVRDKRVDVLALQEFTADAEVALDKAGIADLLPYRETHPAENAGGSAVYTALPLSDGGVRKNQCGFLQAYATLTVSEARPVVMESAHPAAPYNLKSLDCWRTDLAQQPGALDAPATPDGPVRVLAGDFNSTLDHKALRRLVAKGYRDAAAATGKGLVGTWGPYAGRLIPPVTIDHILVDRRIGIGRVSVHGIPGTDHRAVFAELTVPT